MTTEHVTSVNQTAMGLQAVCSCGWRGVDRCRMSDDYAWTNASEEGVRHADQSLVSAFRAHAETMELKAIDFLDKSGRIAGARNKFVTVRMTFIDGKAFTLPRRLENEFRNTTFKLRSTRDDA